MVQLLLVHVRLATLGDVRRYIARPCEQAADVERLFTVTIGCAGRGVAVIPPADGIPFAVTTMRSDGGDLRMAWATGVALAAWLGAGTGFTGRRASPER